MSTKQKLTELLTSGYVKETYNATVPFQLIKLIQIFYDEYVYCKLSNKKLKDFIATPNATMISLEKSFQIKQIKFELVGCPNGASINHVGLTAIGLKLYLPQNIQYVEFYFEITCETLNYTNSIKLLRKAFKINRHTGKSFGEVIFKLSEIKPLQYVYFNCITQIKYIKYTNESKKTDFIVAINKILMQKQCNFVWNINGKLLETCRKTLLKQPIFSDSFDTNNWCLILFSNGVNDGDNGHPKVFLNLLSLPYNIKSIDVKFNLSVNGNKNKAIVHNFANEKKQNGWSTKYGLRCNEMFSEWNRLELIVFGVSVEIINIYGQNSEKINENEWIKYGVVF
eukprot:260878_1